MSDLWVNNPLVLVEKWDIVPKNGMLLEERYNVAMRWVLFSAAAMFFVKKDKQWKSILAGGTIVVLIMYERERSKNRRAGLKFPGAAAPAMIRKHAQQPVDKMSIYELRPERDTLFENPHAGASQNPDNFRRANLHPSDMWSASQHEIENPLVMTQPTNLQRSRLSRIPAARPEPVNKKWFQQEMEGGSIYYGDKVVPSFRPENVLGDNNDYPLTYSPTELQMPRTDYQKRMYPQNRMQSGISHYGSLGDPRDIPFGGHTIPFTSEAFSNGDPFIAGYTVPTTMGYTDLVLDNGAEYRQYEYHPNSKESTIETMVDQEYAVAEDMLQTARIKIASHIMTDPPDGRRFPAAW